MGNSLSLCMMVKNEQQYLPYCLASVYKICDEIIIVDTGSTDKTIEIAEAFGAYVIQAPWKNDFSLIRNIAQSTATSDWIIWLDGDEVLSETGTKKIKNYLLNDSTADFFLCPRVNFWKNLHSAFAYPDSQYKLYRNNIGLKWFGQIHEKIFDESNQSHRKRLKNTDVHIFHYAYVKTSEEVKKKMALYISIENPTMDPRQIDKCSTEHSFFFNTPTQGVQDYNGQLPEIFNKLIVTQEEIKWIDGPSIVKFKTRIATNNYNVQNVDDVKRQTPPVKNLTRINYAKEIKDLCSIVIATHNKIEYVQPCVRDLYSSIHIPFEVIVVDNGSTEQSVMDFLTSFEQEHSNFRFIRLDQNYGFARGYNEGVKESNGEWIIVLNNDTLPTDGCFERMIKHLKDDPEIGIIAPVSNNIHGEHQMIPAPAGSSFGDYFGIMERLTKEPGFVPVVYSSWITGCVMCFHRSLLEQLAQVTSPPRNGILFCEDFKMGMSEDTDLDFTLHHRLHKKLGVARNSFIWHWGQKTLEAVSLDWQKLQEENNQVLRNRWPEIFPNK